MPESRLKKAKAVPLSEDTLAIDHEVNKGDVLMIEGRGYFRVCESIDQDGIKCYRIEPILDDGEQDA